MHNSLSSNCSFLLHFLHLSLVSSIKKIFSVLACRFKIRYLLIFLEILFASLSKCQRLLDTSISISEEEALKKLHYVNAFGLEKFCAFLYQLPNFLQSRPNVICLLNIISC